MVPSVTVLFVPYPLDSDLGRAPWLELVVKRISHPIQEDNDGRYFKIIWGIMTVRPMIYSRQITHDRYHAL